jgi:GTP cyclohydrolase I
MTEKTLPSDFTQGSYMGTARYKGFRFNDYSQHMPHLNFKYDSEYYPEDKDLPDPQVSPFIPGSKITINKVGVNGVDLPVKLLRRDGSVQTLHASVSLYGSLDNPEAKGLNLSRFPIVMHEALADHISIEGLTSVLDALQAKQGSKSIYCKMKFKYPWTQEALRTRKQLPNDAPDSEVFKIVDGVKLSYEKAVGHIFYDCVLEAQRHDTEYKFFLTVDYVYSSTCPCSFELAQDAFQKRGQAANGHSQRSIGKITVQFDPTKPVYIEDIVEMARRQVPTEVVIICKRRDEQAFAELNGSNLLFTEDAVRLMYQGLDEMFDAGRISDFSVVTSHLESLHPWSATAVTAKNIPNGLR